MRPTAFQIVPRENINQFAKDLTAAEAKKNLFIRQYLEKQGRSIKLNLRPVFQSIVFNCDDNEPIKKAFDFLRSQMATTRSQKYYPIEDVPFDSIPKSLRTHAIERFTDQKDKRRKIRMVNANRYEYMVYLQLDKMLDSGKVYIHDTINYRRLEDDLIPYEYWLANREKILSQLNLPILSQPIETLLENLDKALVERYHEVNQSIRKGENKHIKLDKNRSKEVTWRLPYRNQEDAVNNPFYENFTNINIGDVI